MAASRKVRASASSRLTAAQEEARIAEDRARLELLTQQISQVASDLDKEKEKLDEIDETHQRIKKEIKKLRKLRESLQELRGKKRK